MMQSEDVRKGSSPQRFSDRIWRLLQVLRRFNFGTGCNIYYTPPGTQGFAPHYDDIEAFIIQLEGQNVFVQTCGCLAEFARTSSGNFDERNWRASDGYCAIGRYVIFSTGLIHQAVSVKITLMLSCDI